MICVLAQNPIAPREFTMRGKPWHLLTVTVPLLALAACATTPKPVALAPKPVVFAPIPGLERVIGKSEATALQLLGTPTLDRREGPAHQLQFARPSCILDLYFYPDPATKQPNARFADARTPDGKPQDAGSCFIAQATSNKPSG